MQTVVKSNASIKIEYPKKILQEYYCGTEPRLRWFRRGHGRYDIAIIPKDTSKPGIILELKSVRATSDSGQLTTLPEQEAKNALLQINNNAYIAELQQRGINKILKIGLAFSGKIFHLSAEVTTRPLWKRGPTTLVVGGI